MVIPLNQYYRVRETLNERVDVATALRAYESWCRRDAGWTVNGKFLVGRTYDVALALTAVDFAGKAVAEFGARGSFFAAYISDVAARVEVSDWFNPASFRDMGGREEWEARWMACARDPARLTVATRDMRDTELPSESLDVVVSFSAIEHLVRPPDSDIEATRELARLIRPGGFMILSTDIAPSFRRAGGYYYDADALQTRLIDPTGCELYGPTSFDWDLTDKGEHRSGEFMRSCAFFVLRKPE